MLSLYLGSSPHRTCDTSYQPNSAQYHSVLQSTTPVQSATPYYRLHSTTPDSVPQSITPFYKVHTKYYSSTSLYLHSTTRTPYYPVLLQYYKLLSTSLVLLCTVLLQYYSVLQSTTPLATPALLQYYAVLLQYYSVLLQYYSSTTRVLLQYYSQYFSVLQLLQDWSSLHIWNGIYITRATEVISNITKILRLPRKLFSWWFLVTYETSFTISEATEVILQHHQILRLPWKLTAQIWQKFVENSWNVIHNARQSSASSCKLSDLLPFHPLWTVAHQALNPSVPQPAAQTEVYFPRSPLAFCLKKCNVSRCGCLSKFHQYCACSEKWYLNTAPAAKSHTLKLYQILRLQRKVDPLNFSWLCYYYSCLIWLYYYLTLPLLFLDSTITWLYYYLLLLFTWLCFYMTLLFFDLVFYYHLDSTITWPVQFLSSTITWLYIYLILLLLGSTIVWPVLSLDSTSTWLYYYLTLLLLDSTATWLRDVVRISEVSQPKFHFLLIPCFLVAQGKRKNKRYTQVIGSPKNWVEPGRFDGRWPAGLPWWLGKGADAVSWEIDFLVRNSHGGHQQIMTKKTGNPRRVIKNNVIFCRGNWDFVRFQERPLNYMIPQKTTCLTTVHIGDSEWHGFFADFRGHHAAQKKLSKTSKNNRGNRKARMGGRAGACADFWAVMRCFRWIFERLAWRILQSYILLSCCVTPTAPPPGVLWFFCCEFTIRSNFSIQTLLTRPFKKRTLWMADGVKRVMFFSTGYFRSAPNTLLEKKKVPKTNPKATCRRDWSIRGFCKIFGWSVLFHPKWLGVVIWFLFEG